MATPTTYFYGKDKSGNPVYESSKPGAKATTAAPSGPVINDSPLNTPGTAGTAAIPSAPSKDSKLPPNATPPPAFTTAKANVENVANTGAPVPSPTGAGDPLTGRDTTAKIPDTPAGYTAETPYKATYQALTDSNVPAPQKKSDAATIMSKAMPPPKEDTTVVDAYADPVTSKIFESVTKLLNPVQQTSTLLQDYKSLYKHSGLDQINQEIIDADTIIHGTENDIRNEIQTAGGFGTDSQVQAMALARNKSLLVKYNQLVQMKTDATNQLNTLSQLNAQDKQMAQQRTNQQLDTLFKMADFQQQAQNNIKEQARWLTQTMGADGVYNAYSQDPRQLSFLEKSLGLPQGGMASLAQQAQTERARETEKENLQLQGLRSSLLTDQAQRANIYSQIKDRETQAEMGVPTLTGKPQNAIQAAANGYADRLNQANITLDSLGSKFTGSFDYGNYLPNALQSADRQAFEQAKRNFVTAVLRRESGAAISPSEFQTEELKYFPQPGDKPDTVVRKSVARNTAINNVYREANVARPVLPGQIVESGGKKYRIASDGETLEPI